MVEMKWVLLILLLEVSGGNVAADPEVARKYYDSRAECELVRRNLRDVIPVPERFQPVGVCVGPETLDPAQDRP